MFGREIFFTARRKKPPLSHLADCAGHQYRLQLNAYQPILVYQVVKILLVCTPDRQLHPCVDDVPRLEGEIESIMELWCGGRCLLLIPLEQNWKPWMPICRQWTHCLTFL